MIPSLTEGAIEAIMTSDQLPDKPILQVLGQKLISGNGKTQDRFRLLLSDGRHSHSSAMLATQLNDLVKNNEITTNCVMQLDKYMCNKIQDDRKVMIILNTTILAKASEVGRKLGNPQSFKHGAQPSGTTDAAPKPAAPVQKSFYSSNKASPAKPFNQQNPPGSQGAMGTPGKVFPISSLTPYQNRWTIKARVTAKGPIKTWSNSRGEGKLFSMNFMDKSGEIRATAFKAEVDRFYDLIQMDKVYFISKCQVKAANKQFSNLDNDYEMSFTSDTQITPCDEQEQDSVPKVNYNFVPIGSLDKVQPNSHIDVVAVVKQVGDLSSITAKSTGKELRKRDVTLVDESRVSVRVTLWDAEAESFNGDNFPVVALKAARVSDWNGRSLSLGGASQLMKDPDLPEANRLRGWWDSEGCSMEFSEYRSEGGSSGGAGGGFSTNWMTLGGMKSANISGDKPEYFTTKATIIVLKKDNCLYQACISDGCNKKLVDQGNGRWRCEKCQKDMDGFQHRMILQANIADSTDNQWVTMFQDTGEAVLSCSAQDLGTHKYENETQFDDIFQEANFKSYIFKCRTKMETFNDESRLKTVVVNATPINYKEHNARLIEELDTLLSK